MCHQHMLESHRERYVARPPLRSESPMPRSAWTCWRNATRQMGAVRNPLPRGFQLNIFKVDPYRPAALPGAAMSAACLTGCSAAPSRNILGSYFPSWMICVLVGLCATVAVRGLLVRVGIDEELPAPIVVYLALTTAFSFAMWLLWLA